ncbi:unnamed protein product [Mesocestoides corti]|uniref:Dynein light chain n=1 Tax=Mesocestoides corti TaxID=53468 RepID=A0A0R3UGQ1_MESCO|nr:unnamed protein product [Mesocestoides corti]
MEPKQAQDLVTQIKQKVEKVYGPQWNVFVANGGYWSICTHKPGGNLVFVYRGIVYGVYQTPEHDDKRDAARRASRSASIAITSSH